MPELLGHDDRFAALQNDRGCMLSIARLAPQVSIWWNARISSGRADSSGDQDYHRFHSPVEGVVQCIKDIDGEYLKMSMATRWRLKAIPSYPRRTIQYVNTLPSAKPNYQTDSLMLLLAVNPQAVNEGKYSIPRRTSVTLTLNRRPTDLNVFTKNKRSVMLLHANLGPGKEQTPVALVAIGGESRLLNRYIDLTRPPFAPS